MSEGDQDYSGTAYEFLGGDRGIRALVTEFYRQMDTLPETKPIRDMHPSDLTESIEKLYEFLSGWLGGPPSLYRKARASPFADATLPIQNWSGRERTMAALHGARPGHPKGSSGKAKAADGSLSQSRQPHDQPKLIHQDV